MISKIYFSQYSQEEIIKLSNINVVEKQDLISSKLGIGEQTVCSICFDEKSCLGHIGHIKLDNPIFNPLYSKFIVKILNCICTHCNKVPGLDSDIKNINNIISLIKKIKICDICNNPLRTYGFDSKRFLIYCINHPTLKIYPQQVKNIFSKLDDKDIKRLGFCMTTHPKNMILTYLPVIPNCIRASSDLNDQITEIYGKILYFNKNISSKKNISINYINLSREYIKLIGIDRSSDDTIKTLRQRLSGKSGTFRKYMMGKRNKYCGRSVISPDPCLSIYQAGIPRSFVKNFINKNTGNRIDQGDTIILNRQPSLQKMSLTSFSCDISDKIKTIRLNPYVCSLFNADFDGDEMNVFYPTSYLSTVEANVLLNVKQSIISPQSGKAILLPIQDSISGLFILTKYNRPVSKSIFYNCVVSLKKYDIKYTNVNTYNLLSLCFPKDYNFDKNSIKIVNGKYLQGLITKTEIQHIVSDIYKKYNSTIVIDFLDNIQKIINIWMMEYGLSIGIDDCCLKYNKKHTQVIKTDNIYTELSNYTNILNRQIYDLSNNNPLNIMIESKAKGSNNNKCQILISLGQQTIQGGIPKREISKNSRCLPYFEEDEKSYKSYGFCNNSYREGLDLVEYIFHCQSAREGLINTGANTSKTGYMQRKISKSLENIIACYDNTIRRNKDIIQFHY